MFLIKVQTDNKSYALYSGHGKNYEQTQIKLVNYLIVSLVIEKNSCADNRHRTGIKESAKILGEGLAGA